MGPAASTPTHRLVRRALDDLPEIQREVILLHWYEGLSYREAHLLCEMVAATGKLRAMDIVELNPILDDRNRSEEAGSQLILSALGKRIL